MTWVWYHISRDTELPWSLEISPDPPLKPSSKGSPQRHLFQSSEPWSSPSDNTGHCDPHLPSLSDHWESRDELDRVWNI